MVCVFVELGSFPHLPLRSCRFPTSCASSESGPCSAERCAAPARSCSPLPWRCCCCCWLTLTRDTWSGPFSFGSSSHCCSFCLMLIRFLPSALPAPPLGCGRLRQRGLGVSVPGGRRWTRSAVLASRLDHPRPLQPHLLSAFPHQLRAAAAALPVVADLRAAEELPACASGAVLSGCGSPRLRDGGVVPQAAQDVDGAEQSKGGTCAGVLEGLRSS